MKKITLILTVLIATSLTVVGQDKKSYDIDFTDPKSVVNAIFYAAQTRDFAIMQDLCDPFGEGDGDTKELCSVAAVAKQTDDNSGSENSKQRLDEFVKMFESGRINGQVTYHKEDDGPEYAHVPFWFNHPSGDSRSNESLQLVKRDGNWYLSSF